MKQSFRRKSSPTATRRSAGASQTLDSFAQTMGLRSSHVSGDPHNPYAEVTLVYDCVRRLADVFASLPMRLSNMNDEVIEDGPIVQLMQRPNPKMTGRRFRRAARAFLSLFGVVYIVKVVSGNQLLSYGVRSPVEIEEDWDYTTGEIRGYWFTPIRGTAGAGFRSYLQPEEVHRIVDSDYGTGDVDRPLSTRHAAGLAIRQHFKADVANDRSLQYGASGGMGLKTEKNLTQPQREDLHDWLRKQHSGFANRHKWILLEGGLTVERLFNSFQEMEFAELKRMSRDDICVGFGTSAITLGYPPVEGQADDRDNAEMHEWVNTHLPFAEWFAEEWSEAILPHFLSNRSLSLRDASRRDLDIGEKRSPLRRSARATAIAEAREFVAWFDASSVPVLRKAALDEVKSQKEWWGMGVPLNQILAATDAPYEDVPHGDTWWKPTNLVDVEAESLPTEDPTFPPPPPEETPEEDSPEDENQDNDRGGGRNVLRDVSESQLEAIWNTWRMSWRGTEVSYRNRYRRVVMQLRSETLQRLDRVLGGRKSLENTQARDVIGEIVFELSDANGRLLGMVRPLIKHAYELGGTQAMTEDAEARGDEAEPDTFNLELPEVVQSIRRREIQLARSTKTLRREVAQAIADGLDQQETVAQIAERVRTRFNLGSGRASTIARTEVGRAVEEARQLGRMQAGTPLKSWLWSRKNDGRRWHFDTEVQTLAAPVPTDGDFVVASTGNRCPHPRATGDPRDDINCGCTTIGRYPNDDIKAVLARYTQRGFVTDGDLGRKHQETA